MEIELKDLPLWAIITLSVIASIIGIYLLGMIIAHCCVFKRSKKKRDFSNKVILVTGGSSGIGEEFWIDLFFRGATIIFTGRNVEKVKKILERVQKRLDAKKTKEDLLLDDMMSSFQQGNWQEDGSFYSQRLYFYKLEMGSLTAVRAFTNWFKAKFDRLDILANNAGLILTKKWMTEEGFEFTMGVNHYAAFLLTHDLLPLIKSTPESRVINTSSAAHLDLPLLKPARIDLDDLEWENQYQEYDPMHRYCNSKLANVLFTLALSRYLEGENVNAKAMSFHPGGVRSGFGRDLPCLFRTVMGTCAGCFRSSWEGAQTMLFLADEDYSDLQSGMYYDNCSVGVMNKVTEDEEYWKRFWNLSKEQIKSKAGFELTDFKEFGIQ